MGPRSGAATAGVCSAWKKAKARRHGSVMVWPRISFVPVDSRLKLVRRSGVTPLAAAMEFTSSVAFTK